MLSLHSVCFEFPNIQLGQLYHHYSNTNSQLCSTVCASRIIHHLSKWSHFPIPVETSMFHNLKWLHQQKLQFRSGNTRVIQMALMALTEPRTLRLRCTCYPWPRRRVALHMYLLYSLLMFTHHQKDTCVTLFAGAAVILKLFTQRLAMVNHSYYLSLNDFQTLCIQFVFSSIYVCMYQYSYLSTHGISGLAAPGDCQQF